MPWYNDLRHESDDKINSNALVFPSMTHIEKKRTLNNLLSLRKALDLEIAQKVTDQNVIIATWNLKEFGHLTKRLPETYFYIAEIISRFDLVAVQEIKSSLDDFEILMRLLGAHWAYLIADITEGTAGNSERFAYLYDRRRIQPSGLAGEIVLWDDITLNSDIKQLKRTPYLTGFRAGWKNFAIINVHLQPKNDSTSKKKRKEEVRLLLKAVAHKIKDDRFWTNNLMVMGDTNVYSDDNDILELFLAEGFQEVADLQGKPTNVVQSEIYDRIFFRESEYFQVKDVEVGQTGSVFKFFDHVYREKDFASYKKWMKRHKGNPETLVDNDAFRQYFKRFWRGNQMSDHYPVWIQLNIDSTDDFLAEKLGQF